MLGAAIGLLGLGCNVALAADARVAYLPIAFHAESQTIQTTACLQVTERVYPQSAWWENANGNAEAPERAFKAVIAAIKHKDRAALLKLSHPGEGKDVKEFDEQTGALFRQFEAGLELAAVPRGYEFDGLLVYLAKLRFKGETFVAPSMFFDHNDGSFGFLPSRRGQLNHPTYLLVEAWFKATCGPGATGRLTYSTDLTIRRATHRMPVALSGGSSRSLRNPNKAFFLFLTRRR